MGMTNFLTQPNADGLVKLSGTVRNLKVTRTSASFVFTESDQTRMGVVAFAAAIAGLGGQAMATASNASTLEEEADYIEFELERVSQCFSCCSRSSFFPSASSAGSSCAPARSRNGRSGWRTSAESIQTTPGFATNGTPPSDTCTKRP